MATAALARADTFIAFESEQDAYEELTDPESRFDPEEDIADRTSALHVHNALLRMLAENDAKPQEILRTIYEREWTLSALSVVSAAWKI